MSRGSICIVEDEQGVLETLVSYFNEAGFSAQGYSCAEDFFKNRETDFRGLYLIDWNLPGEPGINIVSKIRENDKVSSIFMLSGYSKNDNILTGLKNGADDYITKPFSLDELMARVENALQKMGHIKNDQTNTSEFKLLPEASAFYKGDRAFNLTKREYIIFETLYKSQGRPVSREKIIECFSKDDKMTVRNVDVHVFSLRKKIKEADFKIDTVWGKGYKLI